MTYMKLTQNFFSR